MNFDTAFSLLLGHEGDYSDHPDDPGGKTRYGVTEAVAQEVGYKGDMRELPLELAQRIYRAKYWDEVQADFLPAGIRYVMFDAAVNSGPGQAVRWLQKALGVVEDGILGPKTLAAAAAQNRSRCAPGCWRSGCGSWQAGRTGRPLGAAGQTASLI